MDHITQRLAAIAEDLAAQREELSKLLDSITAGEPPRRPAFFRSTPPQRSDYVSAALNRIDDALDELKDAQELAQ